MPKASRQSVALYWNFLNLHAKLFEKRFGEGAYSKLDNRFKAQEALVDVQPMIETLLSTARTAICSTTAATAMHCCRPLSN